MKFNRILATVTEVVFASCLFSNGITASRVLATEAVDDFDPEVFYHEILNEKRPDGAKYYRFLDINNDGFEELLIYEFDSGGMLELYTGNSCAERPINLFSQQSGSMYNYSLCENGIINYSLSPNEHGSVIGVIRYIISDGQLVPFIGYVRIESKGCFRTDRKEFLNVPKSLSYDSDFSDWESISNVKFGNYYDEAKKEILCPLKESFYYYDAEQKFKQTNKAEPLAITGRYGYDEFLQRYKNYISSVKYEDMSVGSIGTQYLSTDKYSEELRTYTYEKRSDHCFILRDLNGDGIRELVTGGLEENGDFRFFDLYTIYDNNIIHLAASAANHRNIFYLNEDDEIVYSLFGGAANQHNEVFDISKGSLKLKGVLQLENQKYYNYENFGTATENKKEINQKTYEGILKERYTGKLQQDVIMLKDWYPGMRINEDPDGVDSSTTLNDIDKNQPTPKETITPKPALSNTPTPENAETKKPYDTSLLNEDKINLILDQMVEGKPGETVKVGTTIESKKYKYVDTVQLKIEYDPKLKCRLDRTYANTIKDGFCIIKDSSAYEYSIDEYATEIMPGLLFTIPSDAKPGTVYDIVWSDPESFDGFYFFSTHYTLQNYDCNLVNGSIVVLNPDGTLPENISKESGSPSLTPEPVDTSKPTASPSLSNTPELNTYNVTLKNGNQHQITADQNELRYKTNNPDAAVVSSKGLVTAIGEGTAIISVINMDGDVAQLNVTVESIQSIIYGDFNNDGKVDITDLSAISIYLVDKKQLSNAQSKAADVTGDGVVDLSDLAHLRSFLSKKVGWLGNASNILA